MIRLILLLVPLMYATFAGAESPEYSFTPDSLSQIKSFYRTTKTKFNLSDLDYIVKEATRTGKYDSVRMILINPKTVVFEAHEEVNASHLEVVGNQAVTSQDVLKILQSGNSRNDYVELQGNVKKLEEKYQSIGLSNVKIEIKETLKNGSPHYIVLVNEGSASTLEEIIVLSKNKYLNSYIKLSLKSYIGQKINGELLKTIENSINSALIENRILEARINRIAPIYSEDRKLVKLSITLESTTSYEFVFYGNKYFSASNLLAYLEVEKNYLNYIKNQKLLTKNIESLYKQFGFPTAVVVSQSRQIEKLNKHVISFTVREGIQYRIKDLRVSGKISRSPRYYEDILRGAFDELKNPNLYVDENIQKATDLLITELRDEGYLRANKILIDQKMSDNGTVDISVQINEGLLTQIRSIQFNGLKSFTSNQLYEVIDLKPNTPLNLKKILNSYNALKQFYQKNGFLDFEITTPKEKLVSYLTDYEFADLKYDIKEGPKIRVKDIQVRGNSKTKEKVILRELDITEGDVLTSDLVTDSAIFLERTQLFSRAQINMSDVNTDIADRTVFVDVQEKNPGLVNSGLGLSNERGITYRGYLGVSYKNLGGKGRGISGRGDVKYSQAKNIRYPENKVVLGYYEPYMFANRLRGRVSFIHEEEVFDITDDDEVRIREINELSLLVEKQYTRQLKFTWNIFRFSNQRTFDKDDRGDRKTINIGSVGPSIEWDRRDDLFSPKSGTYSLAELEYADPALGSTNDESNFIQFFRATAGHSIYTPLTKNKRFVFVNTLRGGYVENLSNKDQSGVPAAKAFFLGGRPSIRGYDLRTNERVPSLKEVCGGCLLENFKISSESTFFLLRSEMRFPLYGSVGGLVFYDGGAVYIKNLEIEDHYRDALGFGVRLETPIGAFSAELGFKLDRKRSSPIYDNETPFTLHVSMGTF